MNKTFLAIILGLIFIAVVAYCYIGTEDLVVEENNSSADNQDTTDDYQPIEEYTETAKSDLIKIETPKAGVIVGSPIKLSGQVRGTWLFEATAPVVVTNWDGLILGEGYVEAEGNWMTEEFVPFTGEIIYEQVPDSYSASGTIIFIKSNPSGLPEYDDALEMNVLLDDNS